MFFSLLLFSLIRMRMHRKNTTDEKKGTILLSCTIRLNVFNIICNCIESHCPLWWHFLLVILYVCYNSSKKIYAYMSVFVFESWLLEMRHLKTPRCHYSCLNSIRINISIPISDFECHYQSSHFQDEIITNVLLLTKPMLWQSIESVANGIAEIFFQLYWKIIIIQCFLYREILFVINAINDSNNRGFWKLKRCTSERVHKKGYTQCLVV